MLNTCGKQSASKMPEDDATGDVECVRCIYDRITFVMNLPADAQQSQVYSASV